MRGGTAKRCVSARYAIPLAGTKARCVGHPGQSRNDRVARPSRPLPLSSRPAPHDVGAWRLAARESPCEPVDDARHRSRNGPSETSETSTVNVVVAGRVQVARQRLAVCAPRRGTAACTECGGKKGFVQYVAVSGQRRGGVLRSSLGFARCSVSTASSGGGVFV